MQTTQDKINEIRKACIAVNPSILDLEKGCKIYNKNLEQTFVTSYATDIGEEGCINGYYDTERKNGTWIWTRYLGDNFEIIGRDIRLADVIYAINKYKSSVGYAVDSCGDFMRSEDIYRNHWVDELVNWNLLKDSLDDQTPKTIDFIYSLLTNKSE